MPRPHGRLSGAVRNRREKDKKTAEKGRKATPAPVVVGG